MVLDMNKTIAQASLDNLHDILVPPAVGFFPLAPGWYFVLLLLLTLSLHFGDRFFLRYRRDKYRRDALVALPQNSSLEALLSLAKRVGMAAYGRDITASLSGNEWWEFMEAYSEVNIAQNVRKEIERALYDKRYILAEEVNQSVKAFVKVWIVTHRRIEDV